MSGFRVEMIAGFLPCHSQGPVTCPLIRRLAPRLKVAPGEQRLAGFILTMLLAGIVSELLHSGSTVWVILGGMIGYFAMRILAAVQAGLSGRH